MPTPHIGGNRSAKAAHQLKSTLKARGKAKEGIKGALRPEQCSDRGQAKTNSFLVVGVGASAGGLEAFTQLLSALPPKPGMAFILIQHLDPQHHSMLADILSRTSKMPIHEAKDGVTVQPDCIYVIPPNTGIAIAEGKLRLTPRAQSQHPHLPVDFFLRSLAEDQKSNAVGVILSGNGSDGVAGIAAVKAEGGVTFAQDEKSAKFSGMPHSAIASGNVDFVLPPNQIPDELLKLVRHPYRSRVIEARAVPFPSSNNGGLNKVIVLVRSFSGVDFTHYKPPTLQRRIYRRMALRKIEKLEEYASFLQEHPAEVEKLYSDLLINVTSFFRDPTAYEALQSEVLPRIVKNRTPDTPIRIWAPGCSSGEETYSLAIAILEYLGQTGLNIPLQIFGTDVSEASLEKARKGTFQENISEDVTPERLRRFFVRVEGGYMISKSVRDTCVFSRHNLFNDPPFSNMDLVCCRNVLIYMGPMLQKKIIPLLHYALKASGFLFLGPSESVSGFEDMFEAVDKKHRIFLPKPTANRHLEVGRYRLGTGIVQDGGGLGKEGGEKGADVQKEADRMILANHAPSGVIINSDTEVLHFRGRTSPFLEPASGKASFNLLRMARQGLAAPLQIAIKKAKKTNAVVKTQGIPLQLNGVPGTVSIEVAPIQVAPGEHRCFLVLFEENTPAKGARPPKPAVRDARSRSAEHREISQLKRELTESQDAMGALIEAHEAGTEELRSANEEVLSANEELQSTNEELETSKEELQSANEELNTLNEELRNRNQELGQSNSDLLNVMSSANLPLVLVGSDLRIRRFTPSADKAFHIIASDIGRPLNHLRSKINTPDLEPWILSVVDSLAPLEREVQDAGGHWYSLQIRPYRTIDNKIEGAVLSLVDIDTQKRSGEQQRKAREFAEAIVDTVREPLLLLDSNLRILKGNASFYGTFRVTPQETEHKFLYRIGNEQWNIPKLRALLENSLAGSESEGEVRDFEIEHDFPNIGHKTMLANARKISDSSPSREPLILLALEDITARKQAQVALRESERRFRTLFQLGPIAVYYCDASGVIQEFNRRAVELWGRAPEPGDTDERFCGSHKMYRPDGTFMPHEICPMANVLSGTIPEARNMEVHIERPDGSRIVVIVNILPMKNEKGEITGAINCFSDITDHRRSELALRTTEKLASVGRMAATLAHEINNPLESVTNFIYLARQEPAVPEPARNYLKAADEELVRIAHMTKQTLGLYRESNTLEHVIIADLWRDLLSMFSAKTKNRRIRVTLEPRTKAPVAGLAGELRQVFANLLSNSIDAVNLDGAVRIRISDAHKNGNRQIPGVRITIADNGVGIPSASFGRIFEPFFTTKENVGTGLGLWVSREIIESHKGSIRMRSSAISGRSGTAASVFLPCNPPD
jgi:two-component system CheB/CheR fusion protein